MDIHTADKVSNLSKIVVLTLLISSLTVLSPVSAPKANAVVNDDTCDLTVGTGASGDPYLISNPSQLWEMTDCASTGTHFALTNDIDPSGETSFATTSPIGRPYCDSGQVPSGWNEPFSGVLDGRHFTIGPLLISSYCSNGLFGKLENAEIKDLTISGTIVNKTTLGSTVNSNNYSGTLASMAAGAVTLSNVTSNASISSSSRVGGLIGVALGGTEAIFSTLTIVSSSFNGALEVSGAGTDRKYVGGLVGFVSQYSSVSLSHVINRGSFSVSPAFESVGGFLGSTANPSRVDIYSSQNHASVSAQLYVGGLVGSSFGNLNISESQNHATIKANNGSAGGLVGNLQRDSTFSNAINYGAVSSSGNAGGLVGELPADSKVVFSQTQNSASVSAAKHAGGFVGYAPYSVAIMSSTNSGDISTVGSGYNSAGFIGSTGLSSITTISDSVNLGQIGGSSGSYGTGGFIGRSNGKTLIQDSTNSGVVSKSGSIAGGAVGEVTSGQASIVRFANLKNVNTGNGNVSGGIVGYANNNGRVQIENSINVGDISGGTGVGGIIGGNYQNPLTVSSTINRGEVHGLKSVGGILGKLGDSSSAGKANLVRVANLGTVSATTYYAGGLIGEVVHASSATDILQAFNSGTVQATTQYAGGLVGSGTGMYSITQSFNVGQVSAPLVVGGIAGSINQFSLVETYNAGSVSNVVQADGLVQAGTAILVSTSYTATNSRLTISSTEEALKDIDTYENWDFDDVWGIGSCDANGGLPFLVWAAGLVFDLSCLNVQQTPQLVQPQTPPVAPVELGSAPADPYSGPLVTSPSTVVYRGEIVVLEGSKLDKVSQAFILNVEIGILDATSKSITLSISNSIALGSQDLIFLSGHGKLTVMDAVYVRDRAEVEPESGALIGWSWIPKFSGNSRSLHTGQINALATLSERFDEATTVICWGYTTASEPNQWAVEHAQKRAQAACDEILGRSPNIGAVTRIRYGASKLTAMRTAVQFWGSNSG